MSRVDAPSKPCSPNDSIAASMIRSLVSSPRTYPGDWRRGEDVEVEEQWCRSAIADRCLRRGHRASVRDVRRAARAVARVVGHGRGRREPLLAPRVATRAWPCRLTENARQARCIEVQRLRPHAAPRDLHHLEAG